MPINLFMKFRSIKNDKLLKTWLLTTLLMVLFACKKEVVEVTVDAFDQVNAEVKQTQGIYSIQFTLHEYPYKEVGVKLATTKSSLAKNENLVQQIAYPVSLNRYGIFLNTLTANKTYYYQIYVKDSTSPKEVYSDVFSFTTNP